VPAEEASAALDVGRGRDPVAGSQPRYAVDGGDGSHWCSFYGAGAVEDGVAVDVAGTSEAVGIATRHFRDSHGIVGMPLWGELSFLGGPTQAGGVVLEWTATLLGLPERGAVTRLTAQEPPGAGGLVFLPYLSGERAPLWDSLARGVFFGLTSAHGPAALARAALEGVGYAVRHILELSEAAAGHQVCERVLRWGQRW